MKRNVGTGYGKQLFVTTHSPFFVNALSPEDVWVLTKGSDGCSTAKKASEYEFVQALSEEGVAWVICGTASILVKGRTEYYAFSVLGGRRFNK